MTSNKFMKNLGIVGSIWELKVQFCSLYTMFPTCFQVPRPIGTGSGNVLVPGVHKSVVLVIENVPIEITQYMHSEIEEIIKWTGQRNICEIYEILLRCL